MGIVIPFRRRQAGHVDWEVGLFMAACLAVMVLFWTSVARTLLGGLAGM